MCINVRIGCFGIRDFWKGGLYRGGECFKINPRELHGKTGTEAVAILTQHIKDLEVVTLTDDQAAIKMKVNPQYHIGLGLKPPGGVPDGEFSYEGLPLLPDHELRLCLVWKLDMLLAMSRDNPDYQWDIDDG
jgi:hypothetical protein